MNYWKHHHQGTSFKEKMQPIYKYFVTKSIQLQMVLKFQTCFHSLSLYDLLQPEMVGLKKRLYQAYVSIKKEPLRVDM